MIRKLKLKDVHVLFFEELDQSICFNEYVEMIAGREVSYFCRVNVIHFKDITENQCLGNTIEEAAKKAIPFLDPKVATVMFTKKEINAGKAKEYNDAIVKTHQEIDDEIF